MLQGELGVQAEAIVNEFCAETAAVREDDFRLRGRVRLRLGADYAVLPAFSLSLRLSTGEAAFPPSAWKSFSNDFRRFSIQIDRAFVSVKPYTRAELRFGVMPNPLLTPTELLWDADGSRPA